MSASSSSLEETLAGDDTVTPSPPRRAAASSATMQRGATIGRYVVLDRIGRGGMGVVHAAYDPELDRKVAVKVLIPRGSDEADATARQRLLREAQAMARLSHPHVVAVHDAGVHAGRVFVAMEFVEGSTLARWLEAEPRPLTAIVALFVQAGRGLAAAHAKGLVHRDFKPDNVMVSEIDEESELRAQVMDFGLVHALEGDEELVTSAEESMDAPAGNRLTRLGQVLGTPAFMAPEQYEPGPIDARTDQFAFCVALWEAAFGEHPFGGGNPAELAMRVAAGERDEPPPVARAHPGLRAALDRGMSLDRSKRWPSMTALLAELERNPSRRRRRVLVGVAGVVAVGLLLGAQRLVHARAVAACEREGTGIEDTWNDAARVRVREGLRATGLARAEDSDALLQPWLERHAEQWRDARTGACLATEVDERWSSERKTAAVECLEDRRGDLAALVDVLAHADRETVDHAVTLAANLLPPWLCVDDRTLTHRLATPSSDEARAEHQALQAGLARARALWAARRFDEARTALDELRPRLDALGDATLHVQRLGLDGLLEDAAMRYEAAEVGHREAFARALELGALDLAAEAAERLAMLVGSRLDRPSEGVWWTDVAQGLYRRMGEADDGMRMASVLRQRAALRQKQGQLSEALTLAERALEIGQASLGAEHPALVKDLQRLAQIQTDLGQYAEAEALARRALTRAESALGAEHPSLASVGHTLAEAMRRRGRNGEALAEHRRALAIAEAALPPDHPDLATSLTNVALSLHEDDRTEEALPLLERALTITESSLGPDHIQGATILINLGNAQQSLGTLEAAASTFERALTIVETKLGAAHPTAGVVLVNLANTEMLLQRHEVAATHMKQALAVLEASLGPAHANVGMVLINLAEVQRQLGWLDDAASSNERALAVLEAALDPQHPDVAYPLHNLALVELARGRPEAARPPAERALQIRTIHAMAPDLVAEVRWTLAQVLRASGVEPARARSLAGQALETFETGDHANHSDHDLGEIEAFLAAPER